MLVHLFTRCHQVLLSKVSDALTQKRMCLNLFNVDAMQVYPDSQPAIFWTSVFGLVFLWQVRQRSKQAFLVKFLYRITDLSLEQVKIDCHAVWQGLTCIEHGPDLTRYAVLKCANHADAWPTQILSHATPQMEGGIWHNIHVLWRYQHVPMCHEMTILKLNFI